MNWQPIETYPSDRKVLDLKISCSRIRLIVTNQQEKP